MVDEDDTSDDKRRKAFHEAGHVIAALAVGGSVARVRIFMGQKEWKGATEAAVPKENAKGKALYLWAGSVAQSKCDPAGDSRYTDEGDLQQLTALADIETNTGPLLGAFVPYEDKRKRDRFLDEAKNDAIRVMDSRWHQVEKIAIALLEHTELLEADVRRLLLEETEG